MRVGVFVSETWGPPSTVAGTSPPWRWTQMGLGLCAVGNPGGKPGKGAVGVAILFGLAHISVGSTANMCGFVRSLTHFTLIGWFFFTSKDGLGEFRT